MRISTIVASVVAAVCLSCVRGNTATASDRFVKNGEFDQWTDGKPTGWNVPSGVVAAADKDMQISGTAAIRLHPERTHPDMYANSSISQEIQLKPQSTYRLTFWAAADGSGDVRAYVVPRDGGKPVLEYTSGWGNFFPWTQISTTFKTRDATQYTLRLIKYGAPSVEVWFDHLELERMAESGAVSPLLRGADRPGVDLFTQSYMVPFRNDTLDPSAQQTNVVNVQTPRGEYEPCLVGIHSRRDRKAVDLRVAGDLLSAEGRVMKSDAVVVRAYENGVLPPSRPRDVAPGHNLGWWLTVRADADTLPGRYAGVLEITAGPAVIANAELTVDVLDIVLPTPKAAFFVYHSESYFAPEDSTPALKRAYYKDMVEHGMTTVTVYGAADAGGGKIDFGHNYVYSPAKRPLEFSWGFDQSLPALLGSGLPRNGQPLILLCGSPSKETMQNTLKEWKQRGWPEFLFYVNDEPSSKAAVEATRPVLEQIKAWKLPLRTVTAGLDIPGLGHLYDVWIQIESDVNFETIAAARKNHAELWTYNCNVAYVNAPFDRALYGFWAYRSGVRGVARWAYHDQKTARVDDDGTIHGAASPHLSRVFTSSKGPVPTVGWEATREGVEDYRLMMLFDATLAEANAQVEKLKSQYEKLLTPSDIRLLTQIAERTRTKQKPDEQPLLWEAKTDAQIAGRRLFEAAQALEDATEKARLARKKVFESIPGDAMAVRGGGAFGTVFETLCPPLGLGDQRTVAEIKRRTLIGYLQRLRTAKTQASKKG